MASGKFVPFDHQDPKTEEEEEKKQKKNEGVGVGIYWVWVWVWGGEKGIQTNEMVVVVGKDKNKKTNGWREKDSQKPQLLMGAGHQDLLLC